MAQNRIDNFNITAPKHVDNRYTATGSTPWASVSAAHAGITYKVKGLSVLIDKDGTPTEYWYRDGITQSDLIEKKDMSIPYTIEELRLLDTSTDAMYTSKDGGTWIDMGLNDGQFEDNYGTIVITANGHILKRQFLSSINPIWFQADPTGILDSTSAIQAAINSAIDTSPIDGPQDPTKIELTDGIYNITGSGLIMDRGVSLVGIGRVIFDLTELTSGAYAVSITNNTTTRKVTVSGITFNDKSISNTKNGLLVTSHDNVIEGNKFYSLNECVKVDGFNGNIIRENFFYLHKTGVYLYGFASQTYIEHNDFHAGLSSGVASIRLNDNSSPTPLQSAFITNNWFENNNAIPDILGRKCSNVFISKYWAEDYNQAWTGARIDIDQSAYPMGNVSIKEGRMVVKAGTVSFIKLNCSSVTIEDLDVHQDNEVPTIDLVKSESTYLKNIRFTSIEGGYESSGFGVKTKGGIKVINEDIKETLNQSGSVGGIQLSPGRNIYFDSGFKFGTHLQTTGTPATISLDTTTGVFDSSSAKIVFPINGGFSSTVFHTKEINAVTGDNIRVAFWAKTDGSPKRILAKISGWAAYPAQDIYLTDNWRKFYVAIDNVAETGTYGLYFQTYEVTSPFNVWIDDIQGDCGPNVKDFSSYIPNNSLTKEVTINKGLQLPEYFMGEAKYERGDSAPTYGTWTKGSVVYNDKPITGSYIGWVCTVAGTPGLWKGFGVTENTGLNWTGKSSGVSENDTPGLSFTGSGSTFGNVARSIETFTANSGILTGQLDKSSYSAGNQAMLGFTSNASFSSYLDLRIAAYWSATGFTVYSGTNGGDLSGVIDGVNASDYIRLRPTDTNTFVDKSADGFSWTTIFTPSPAIVLNSTFYAAIDFNANGGDKSINNITQSVGGEYSTQFLLEKTKIELDNRTSISVKDFGAVGDGSDSLIAFQNAVAAVPSGGAVYVPSGSYTLSNTLVINKPLVIRCEGSAFAASTSVAPTSSFPNGAPLIHFTNPLGRCAVYNMCSFMNRKGGDWITFDGDVSNVEIEGCHVRQISSGHWGLNFDSPSAINGAFLLQIINNLFYDFDGGAIRADKGGDSCNILRNCFQLLNSTSYLLYWNGKVGTSHLNFSENNATGASKFIFINTVMQAKITKNQLEATTPIDNSDGAMIVIGGDLASDEAIGYDISDNNLNGHDGNALTAIHLKGCRDTHIRNNGIFGVTNSVKSTSLTRATTFLPGFTEGVINDVTNVISVIHGSSESVLQGDLRLSGVNTSGLTFGANGDTTSFLNVDLASFLTSADGRIRLFRKTNTTGNKSIEVYKGDGSGTQQHEINSNGDTLLNLNTGGVQIGCNDGIGKLEIAGGPIIQRAILDPDLSAMKPYAVATYVDDYGLKVVRTNGAVWTTMHPSYRDVEEDITSIKTFKTNSRPIRIEGNYISWDANSKSYWFGIIADGSGDFGLSDATRDVVIFRVDKTTGNIVFDAKVSGDDGTTSNDFVTKSQLDSKKAAASTDTTTTVTTTDATDAATTQSLVNELKATINTLTAELHDLKSKMRTAGLLA